MKLALYASREGIPEGIPHLDLLFPWWGIPKDSHELVHRTRFGDYLTKASDIFELVSDQRDCDAFLLPVDWGWVKDRPNSLKRIFEMGQHAADQGKPFLIFYHSDDSSRINVPGSVVFRTSVEGPPQANERVIPPWPDDFVGRLMGGKVSAMPQFGRPTVGFCGFAGYRLIPHGLLRRKARSLLRFAGKGFPTMTVREKAIVRLRSDRRVIDDFLLRENFYAGVRDEDLAVREYVHDEFRLNILRNAYTLAARGGGNFSYRFYECLAAGRPPLFVDTFCSLPFEREVAYEEIIVRVGQPEIEQIADRLVDDHESLNATEFMERQHFARDVWRKWLSPLGFYARLYQMLR